MSGKSGAALLGVIVGIGGVVGLYWADTTPEKERRQNADKAYQTGNYKDAYESFRQLALDPRRDHKGVLDDLDSGIRCLEQLGRIDEVDDFREAVIAVHKDNWRLLDRAARTYAYGQHFGYIVAGKFYRGNHRGGGRYVSCAQRDRVRALQLMQEAMRKIAKETNKDDLARFYLHFAEVLISGTNTYEPWRLQYLTNLEELPDYEDGYGQNSQHAAPVLPDGSPVYHKMPRSYEEAASDGERWRWMLAQAAEYDPNRLSETEMIFAEFLRGQFDVQTLAEHGFRQHGEDEQKDNKNGIFTVHTLSDDETIAHLANGIKCFKLPEEFNWIKIYQRVAGRGRSSPGEEARNKIAQIYEDRRQYVKAAGAWKLAIDEYGRGHENSRQKRLDQIVGTWGRFEPAAMQAPGKSATVDFRFRNGTKVSFEAHAIKVPKLLDDVKAYLTGHQGQLDGNRMNIDNIGYRLVERQENQYLGDKVAAWDLPLKPRPEHVDDRVTVITPLQKPGAYLVTARMENGSLSRIVVWISDTVILKKQLEDKAFYYVADAQTGQPVPGASVEFFGYRQQQVVPNQNNWKTLTTRFTQTSDPDGQLFSDPKNHSHEYQWLITARKDRKNQEGVDRLAYLGFSGVWYGRGHDTEYNQTKVFTITDRPVYRPMQEVKFKVWIRHAKYDQADTSSFANKRFTVQINNPQGEKVFEKAFLTDAYGGLDGSFPLSKEAMLGMYSLYIPNQGGGGQFRVEEYKKPEFEVEVEAPKEPVRLGEKVTATIKAKYYFGAPVTKARVKYKVMRSSYSSRWYPAGAWDWFYGCGYWWFAADYIWYPGWNEWGCRRPIPSWWNGQGEQPELFLENEVEIGADGTVRIDIDTLPAKELHGDQDHQYAIRAEVVDESRRVITGTGNVLVSRKPFSVFTWVDHGHYRAGDTVKAYFRAQTLDQKPVEGKGELTLYQITYNDKNEPVEKAVQTWKLDTSSEGAADQQLKAAEPGQYRLSYKLTDTNKHTIEGGYLFVVRGQAFDGKEFRFNDLELTTDKREYAPGDKVKLQINTNRQNGVVLLFVRPTNGICQAPKVLRLRGKSIEQEVAVVQRDMPNFFIEALTVSGGRVHTEVREVIVPPEKRVLNVEVIPSATEYKPGQKATVKLKLTDFLGQPFVGSLAVSIYDRSVEYISGGSNVPEIKEFFWKWRRRHHPQTESSLAHWFGNLLRNGEIGMSDLGVFGTGALEEQCHPGSLGAFRGRSGTDRGRFYAPTLALVIDGSDSMNRVEEARPGNLTSDLIFPAKIDQVEAGKLDNPVGNQPENPAQPTIRKNFADTALWIANLTTDKDGLAEVSLTMPENLTGWNIKTWGMGHGTKVGQGEAIVTTKKDLIVRLQAPRFFVQKDEVVLSANVHNYLKNDKKMTVSLELDGGTLSAAGSLDQQVVIPANGEKRIDWRVKVTSEGEAVVRMKAITDEDSDAMEMRFPCYVHGMLKMDSFAGVVRPDGSSAQVTLTVPAERRINDTRLEVRYSPTLAGAMVDALPYLVDYPYGCTEQTLNRFLPTVIKQRVLQRMNLDLKDIEKKRTNLNAQEIGNDKERARGWKRYPRNPVFDEAEVKAMSAAGVQALTAMQLSDGGWGWFSGFGEHSYPHTTAVVVHGLQLARQNDITIPPGVLERGVEWLKSYQAQQLRLLQNAPTRTRPLKEHCDNLDAMVYMTLFDAEVKNDAMRDLLYRDRMHLAIYAKGMLGLALHKQGNQDERLDMILKNIDQYLVEDEENQTAYLKLPTDNYWWYWYGSENEANAYYLKLLSRTSPKDPKASRLVKYLLNNRKHGSYWNSTRDTAVCIEAMAEYLKASGEDKPDLTVEVWLDGKKHKEVHIDQSNLFTFDNQFVLLGDAVDSGKHVLELKKRGTGPVYFNAYLTNFTLEDFITKAGLEVKVNRKYYKLTRVDKTIKVPGARGQAADQKVEKYERTELKNLDLLKSGDLCEIELEIDSKNDYEYVIFEDMKASGFEPVAVRSGYSRNDLGAYMELRDEKVCFFVRALARGKHSVSYRMRAEIPGKFSALPTRAYAMYAPELKGNSDEIKLAIED